MTSLRIAATVLLCLPSVATAGQEVDPSTVVADAVEAAQELIRLLSEEQREAFLFKFQDEQQRHNWSNLPTGIVERKGLRWGDLDEEQQRAVMKLLATTLSKEGLQQIVDNMEGDEVLHKQSSGGGRRNTQFGRDEYYVSVLGVPSTTTPWMWQFGGHHLGINATIVGDRITLAPSLTGGQPVDFEHDGRQVRQLAGEEDAALALIAELSEEQRARAIVDTTHTDMIWGPGREGAQPRQEGICAADLTGDQQQLLLRLIGERIRILNAAQASVTMKQIQEQLDETWFAWFGPTETGSAFAFRIQGPRLLMEYSPQRLGGDLTNHTHAMYRDPMNDYGVHWIRTTSTTDE